MKSFDDAFNFSNEAGKELDMVVRFWELAIFYRRVAECGEGVQDTANGWRQVGEASGRGTGKVGQRKRGDSSPDHGREQEAAARGGVKASATTSASGTRHSI